MKLLFCLCLVFATQILFAASKNTESSNTQNDIKNPANPYNIDYPNLDSRYYPHIRARNKFYDSEIIEIIHNVDSAEKKNTLFVGALYGVNINQALLLFSPISGNAGANFGLFGLRAGYQKYTGSVFPINHFGYQIYIDAVTSFGRNGVFFTGMNADMLWDFLDRGSYIGALNLGLGIGMTKITGLHTTKGDIYEAGYKINLGLSLRYPAYHHRAGIYFGSMQGLEQGFLSYTIMIGYDYVF